MVHYPVPLEIFKLKSISNTIYQLEEEQLLAVMKHLKITYINLSQLQNTTLLKAHSMSGALILNIIPEVVQ